MYDTRKPNENSSKTRVAVIDDDPRLGRTFARLIKSDAVVPEVFSNPEEGLEAIKKGGFEVVVSDIIMPRMDGIGLMREIRKLDFDLPVILLTGTPTFGSARRAVEFGAFRYLIKPPDPNELRAVVSEAAFSYRIARIRHEAAELQGLSRQVPGDLVGLDVAFDMALETMWMAYQPIVRARDGSIFGYEALMRSESEVLPHPGAILSAAETLGRLNDVGRVVRHKSPAPMRDVDPEVLLFVNLHPRDLLDENLLDNDGPLPEMAKRVVLEITERASLDRVPNALETIASLREQSYRLALDDLGSGYAGLTSFATLEPEFVKVDMTLIRDIDSSRTKQRLVQSVVELSRDMGRQVVAEGIETMAEREQCVALGVDLLQGYFIAKPGRPFPEIQW